MIIGITGGSGAGKSFISEIFAEKGFKIVDADAIAKNIMDTDGELVENIGKVFGKEFITVEGKVDRRALGRLVFADAKKRETLNAMTHPKIIEQIKQNALEGGNVVIDIPLLKNSSIEEICDVKIAVLCDRKTRIARIMTRDKIDRKTAENRINSQISDDEYIKFTDEQIVNNGSKVDVVCQINDIITRLKRGTAIDSSC